MLTNNNGRRNRNRSPAYVQLVSNSESPTSDSLNLLSTELGNDRSPLADGRRADVQRPRDIRGALKVINNGLLEHHPSLSALKGRMQVHSQLPVLTLVDMDKQLVDMADRLADAIKAAGITDSELARECRLTPTAVHNWMNRKTLKMSADNYHAAARALGVREEWLRTGKAPRERDSQEMQFEQFQSAVQALGEPLTAAIAALTSVLAAVEAIAPSQTSKKRRSKS